MFLQKLNQALLVLVIIPPRVLTDFLANHRHNVIGEEGGTYSGLGVKDFVALGEIGRIVHFYRRILCLYWGSPVSPKLLFGTAFRTVTVNTT